MSLTDEEKAELAAVGDAVKAATEKLEETSPLRTLDPELAGYIKTAAARAKPWTEEDEKRERAKEARARRMKVLEQISDEMDLPLLDWALYGEPAPPEAAHVPLHVATELSRERRLLVLGGSGTGKTSLLLRAMGDLVRAASLEALRNVRRDDFVIVEAPELAHAGKRTAGAKGAELIARAKDARVLILDELGGESVPGNSPVTDVIRFRAYRKGATWMTSGLTEEQLVGTPGAPGRYDDGIVRRLLERGLGHVVRLPLEGGLALASLKHEGDPSARRAGSE